jgi:hypothetical protein
MQTIAVRKIVWKVACSFFVFYYSDYRDSKNIIGMSKEMDTKLKKSISWNYKKNRKIHAFSQILSITFYWCALGRLRNEK